MKMNLLIIAAFLGLSLPVYADSCVYGEIDEVHIGKITNHGIPDNENVIRVELKNGEKINADPDYNLNTDRGRAMLSLILSAKLSGSTVVFWSNSDSNCNYFDQLTLR